MWSVSEYRGHSQSTAYTLLFRHTSFQKTISLSEHRRNISRSFHFFFYNPYTPIKKSTDRTRLGGTILLQSSSR